MSNQILSPLPLVKDESVFESSNPHARHLVPMSQPADAVRIAAEQLANRKRLLEEKFEQQKAAIKRVYKHHAQQKKYGKLLEQQQEQEEKRFGEVEKQLAELEKEVNTIVSTASTSASSKPVIPGGTGNTLQESKRFFRVLVWNLENFTSDARPRGSEPIAFRRNQARIAAVVATMKKYKVDLLLAMETGSDVSEAMTAIARSLGEQWHPLVSVPTGARPEVRPEYVLTLGRPTARRALALSALTSIYVITPREGVPAFSDDQVNDALDLLPDVSRPVRLLEDLYTKLIQDAYDTERETTGTAAAAIRKLIGVALVQLAEVQLDTQKSMEAELKAIEESVTDRLDEAVVGVKTAAQNRRKANREAVEAIASKEASGDIAGAIAETRRHAIAVAEAKGGDPHNHLIAAGWLRALELLLLFSLKQTSPLDTRPLDSDAPGAGAALVVFFCTGIQKVRLTARNAHNPLAGADEDVMLHALLRIGAESFHYETYGMVYKPPYETALEDLFKTRAWSLGVTDDPFPRAYQIVQWTRKGQLVLIQAGALNWRSALEVTIPISSSARLPLALYHTRYSGSEVISVMDPRFIAGENTILARCVSVAEVARWAVSYAPEQPLPFIVGDFNLPTAVVDGVASPTSVKDERMQILHDELTRGMAALGYLRHAEANGRHPPTTLVSYTTLALGQKRYSESYDGVYEPVTWAKGGMRSRSSAIRLDGVVDDALMKTDIEVKKALPTNEQDVGLDDEDDEQDTNDVLNSSLDTSFDAERSDDTETVAAGTVFAHYTLRVYKSILAKIRNALGKREAWLYSRRTRAPFQAIYDVHKNKLEPHAKERTEWFFECCLDSKYELYKKLTRPDPLEEWRNLLQAAYASADDYEKPILASLEKVVVDALTQLSGIERMPEARMAIAYRAVVSDHLPILLEIDMNPS